MLLATRLLRSSIITSSPALTSSRQGTTSFCSCLTLTVFIQLVFFDFSLWSTAYILSDAADRRQRRASPCDQLHIRSNSRQTRRPCCRPRRPECAWRCDPETSGRG